MSSVPSQRHEFKHGGRVIYAWEQDLSEVQIDIPLPPGATKKDLVVTITGDQLTVGLKGVPPYLDVGVGKVLAWLMHCLFHLSAPLAG